MTQVTQIIIAPSSDRQISNLIRGIVDIATRRPANAETLKNIHTLAAEAIAMMESQHVSKCHKCGGTGMADSGGTQPWGEPILIECDCQLEQQGDSEWIEWGGADTCPVPNDAKAEIKFRDGDSAELDTWLDILEWRHKGYGSDIIAYRVVKS